MIVHFERCGHVIATYRTGYDVRGGEFVLIEGVCYPVLMVRWTPGRGWAMLGDPAETP